MTATILFGGIPIYLITNEHHVNYKKYKFDSKFLFIFFPYFLPFLLWLHQLPFSQLLSTVFHPEKLERQVGLQEFG